MDNSLRKSFNRQSYTAGDWAPVRDTLALGLCPTAIKLGMDSL